MAFETPPLIRKIIHIDMDAFFASIEQRDTPEYRGVPVVVGGCSSRGVVCAASYEARRYNIHSALAMKTAKKRCPHAIFLPPRIEYYAKISREIMKIFHEITDLVEPLSLDEAFLDVTENMGQTGYASTTARELKERVKRETGLTASAGVSINKFIAKIASDYDKPDGLVVVPTEKIRSFIDPLPVGKIHGVGRVTESRLHAMGIYSISSLAKVNPSELVKHFGKMGHFLYNLSRGVDHRPVNSSRRAKSMGEERTFERDINDKGLIVKKILSLTNKLAGRLERRGLRAKTLTVKVRFHDFAAVTRSRTLSHYTREERIIAASGLSLLDKTDAGKKPVRTVGISASNFTRKEGGEQLLLFDPEEIFGWGRAVVRR